MFLEKQTKRLGSMRNNIWVVQTIAGVAMDPPQIKVVGESLQPALGGGWSRPSSLSVGAVSHSMTPWWSEKILQRQSPVSTRDSVSFLLRYLVLQKKTSEARLPPPTAVACPPASCSGPPARDTQFQATEQGSPVVRAGCGRPVFLLNFSLKKSVQKITENKQLDKLA